ncbi:OB-fold domain-containing protein [Streptomyces sp. NPDC051162]|uniref:bifunctional MaoC family dehydratase N-terminal/OB-fold nucleic acid binding domain-containing protein n=1 Tax=unclassified Streptomyces TaxID=2593676 RepID=UPI0034218CDB
MDDPEDVYPLLKSYEGRPVGSGRGKDPVNAPMIRHWCEAMGDAHPAYAGADPVAPPTMLQVWTMGGLSGPVGRAAAYGELLALLDSAGCTAVVATDCEQEYLRPLRPGDVITYESVIESVSPRKTTKLGTGHFVTTRMDVRADGELAGTHRFRILKYAPTPRKYAPAPLKYAPAPRKYAPEAPGSGYAPAKNGRASGAARPRPVVNRDNAGFWDGVARRKLLIQRCDACAALRFPWLPGCGGCGSPEWTAVEASGAGTVYSYVVMHHPPFPAFDPPYAVVLIELAEGVRMISNVTGVAPERVRIGMPVELEFVGVDGGQLLPVFRALAARVAR